MTTLASSVNEKIYHAELLLALQQEQPIPAKQAALEGAVAATLQAAFALFIRELAEAVQIPTSDLLLTAETLAEHLDAEERSFSIVDNWRSLEADSGSWVAQVQYAYQQFIDRSSTASKSFEVSSRIPAVALDEVIDLSACLQAFKSFVLDSRGYFQEW